MTLRKPSAQFEVELSGAAVFGSEGRARWRGVAENSAHRFKYEVDKLFAAGWPALVGCLALATCIIVLVAGVVLVRTGAWPSTTGPLSTTEAVWVSLMRALDPGTMGADAGWGFRAIMLVVTLLGILLVSTLVAVINSAFTQEYDRLRRGSSWAWERDHVVILGWSEVVPAVVRQLAVAAASARRGRLRVLLLSEKDPVSVADEIAVKVRGRRSLRLIYRKGQPTSLEALRRVRLSEARSVIVVAPSDARTDDRVMRTVLAVRRECERTGRAKPPGAARQQCEAFAHPSRAENADRWADGRGELPIAVELRDSDRIQELQLCAGGTGDQLHVVKSDQLLARVTVQSSRHSGLSQVYSELMAFEGNEIYARPMPPELIGFTFGEATPRLSNVVPIGIRRCVNGRWLVDLLPNGDDAGGGRSTGTGRLDAVLCAGDELIVVAEDVGVRPQTVAEATLSAAVLSPPEIEAPEDIVILGWNSRGERILRDLDRYAPAGSTCLVVRDPKACSDALNGPGSVDLRRLDLAGREAKTHARAVVEELALHRRDRVIVLGCGDKLGREGADTRTLLALQNIRELLKTASRPPTIVSELLDQRNRDLADAQDSDDFVVSDHLISLLLAQVAENDCARVVLDELLSPNGAVVFMWPAKRFGEGSELADRTFRDLQRSALRAGAVVIGYRIDRLKRDGRSHHGVTLNPPARDAPCGLVEKDSVVVIAQDLVAHADVGAGSGFQGGEAA